MNSRSSKFHLRPPKGGSYLCTVVWFIHQVFI